MNANRRPLRLCARLLTMACAGVVLAACGATIEGRPEQRTTATVNRCGEKVTYTTPQRSVVYEAGSAEKMFALGLTEHVRGYVMPPANPPIEESPWASEYSKVEYLGDDLLNRELVVEAQADFVVAGWGSGFSESRGITPAILDGLGIQSFLHTESCYNYPEHPEKMRPFEALYTDLERLGEIFGVEEKARQVVDGYKQRVQSVKDRAPAGEPVSTFLYDSGTDQPYTAGNQVPPNDIIDFSGGRNIFADLDERWTQVSWESVVEKKPEVIIILDYGDKPAEEKIEFLRNSPITARIPAVEKNNFYILDYNEGISGPRNIDGLEGFGKYLRDLRGE